jgi:nucleoside phosphorylase
MDTPYFFRNKTGEREFDVILAQSADRGNTPCAELVRDIAERFRPEFIILSGIAGGLEDRDEVSLGDVIIADHVDYYEMRKFSSGKDRTRRLAFDHPSKFLRETIAHRVRHFRPWKTSIKVESAYQQKILDEFDKAIAVDMESYGLARGVYSARATRYYNLNYLVVRGVSDLAGSERNDADRKVWRDYAASTAAAFSMNVVDEIISHCP